jgi:hypothetical protein
MDRYEVRMNLHGTTQRERLLNRTKINLQNKLPNSLSYKDVVLNGEKTQLIINTSTKPYFKEFESLPNQKVLAGDYVEWANSTWLVLNADCDDEIYTDGNLYQCQHCIYWQKPDGAIVSRFVYTENASAYNNGETGNNTITLQSNQFMVYMPYDEETAELDNGIRIHMSRSNSKCKPYDLTRPDDITYGFGEKGGLNSIFTQTQYNQDKDKLVTLDDGTKVWICDYIEMDNTEEPTTPSTPESGNETSDLSATISGNKNLKVGFARTYTATIVDENGNAVAWNDDYSWNVVSDFKVVQEATDNKIELFVDDEELIDSSFLLQVIVDNAVVSEIEITVMDAF